MRTHLLCLVAFSFVSQSFLLCEEEKERLHYGLAELEDHELEHLESSVHKVIEVLPNQIAFERTFSYKIDEENKPEFTTLQASADHALTLLSGSFTLPSKVDNSKLPSFPPIANQGSLGSCVAFASTYYQATHEIGLLRNIDNKANVSHILSPKWTYNLINKGANVGSSPVDAYKLLSINGAPSLLEFPYDNNYTAWDLNPKDWISALYNRLGSWTLIPGLGGNGTQNLTAIKQALCNGHVLTFGSFINSWVFTRIKAGPHAGEYAASWMNGTNGGHFMAIVGYDDDVWIDINNNGVVDEGEKGAFLIANSWGTEWGNQGFIWISYDAFLSASKVPGAPGPNRVPAGIFLNSCVITSVPKASYYTPKLLAQFSITQSFRNEISIAAGVSKVSDTTPLYQMKIPAFAGEGANFEFDGGTADAPETATFTIDLTDLIPQESSEGPFRYYLLVQDNKEGHPTLLNSFSLLDLTSNRSISTLLPLPQTYDNRSGALYIDYALETTH
jgi:C1A family cysteine protease